MNAQFLQGKCSSEPINCRKSTANSNHVITAENLSRIATTQRSGAGWKSFLIRFVVRHFVIICHLVRFTCIDYRYIKSRISDVEKFDQTLFIDYFARLLLHLMVKIVELKKLFRSANAGMESSSI